MIARIWHGYTKPEHADAYEAMLKPELLSGISKGYRDSSLLRKEAGNEVEFITSMLWDSIDAIRRRRTGLRDCRDPRGAAQIPCLATTPSPRITKLHQCRSGRNLIRHNLKLLVIIWTGVGSTRCMYSGAQVPPRLTFTTNLIFCIA